MPAAVSVAAAKGPATSLPQRQRYNDIQTKYQLNNECAHTIIMKATKCTCSKVCRSMSIEEQWRCNIQGGDVVATSVCIVDASVEGLVCPLPEHHSIGMPTISFPVSQGGLGMRVQMLWWPSPVLVFTLSHYFWIASLRWLTLYQPMATFVSWYMVCHRAEWLFYFNPLPTNASFCWHPL